MPTPFIYQSVESHTFSPGILEVDRRCPPPESVCHSPSREYECSAAIPNPSSLTDPPSERNFDMLLRIHPRNPPSRPSLLHSSCDNWTSRKECCKMSYDYNLLAANSSPSCNAIELLPNLGIKASHFLRQTFPDPKFQQEPQSSISSDLHTATVISLLLRRHIINAACFSSSSSHPCDCSSFSCEELNIKKQTYF